MSEKENSPNIELARSLLGSLWLSVTQEDNRDGDIDKDIDSLIKSEYLSIRYCLPTQILGKLTDSKLNCLCLQKGDGSSESQWDPRSFSAKVIAPWVLENQSVLGASADPYVSKPLRRSWIEENPNNVKGLNEWKLLYRILSDIEARNSKDYTQTRMLQVLASIHKALSKLTFDYILPERVSIDQTQSLVYEFLSEPSGGERGLSIVAALFETFGKHFGIYKEVKRYVINASDQSTGLPADIVCIDKSEEVKLAIEVKERKITIADIRNTVQKARKLSLKEVLFSSSVDMGDEDNEISDAISQTWTTGTNLYHISISDLIRAVLPLTGEQGRIDFLNNVGIQLNKYNTQPANRTKWKELLERV